jgi:hypothetical protein
MVDLRTLAAGCARRVPAAPRAFHQDKAGLGRSFDELLEVVRVSDPRFAFDVDGRPAAIQAIRQALPAMEAELFDAVLEDLTCEAAAREEAVYRIAIALTAPRADDDAT